MTKKTEVHLMEVQGLRIDFDTGAVSHTEIHPEIGFFRVTSSDEDPMLRIEVHVGGEVVNEAEVPMSRVLMIQYRRK